MHIIPIILAIVTLTCWAITDYMNLNERPKTAYVFNQLSNWLIGLTLLSLAIVCV